MEKLISSSLDGKYLLISDMVHLDRYQCTENSPWVKGRCLWAIHPDAIRADNPADSGIIPETTYICISWRCPNCGHYWSEYWAHNDEAEKRIIRDMSKIAGSPGEWKW